MRMVLRLKLAVLRVWTWVNYNIQSIYSYRLFRGEQSEYWIAITPESNNGYGEDAFRGTFIVGQRPNQKLK